MRKLTLGIFLLAAFVAPFAFAAPADAALKPVKVQLLKVECTTTQDQGILGGGPADELVVQVGDAVVFGPEDIDDGETADLSGVGLKKFRRSIKVTLIDEDVTSPDDILGTVTIRRGLAGDGVQQVRLQENGADYTLFFKVVK